jgi:hypothetical protein
MYSVAEGHVTLEEATASGKGLMVVNRPAPAPPAMGIKPSEDNTSIPRPAVLSYGSKESKFNASMPAALGAAKLVPVLLSRSRLSPWSEK